MDHVRDLLTAAADTIGWQIDLDQLPVTCAQVPTDVLTLIDASAAHLAALAGQGMLDQAAASIRTVMDGADGADIDWHARLLATVLDQADARRHHLDHTRRRLTAALRALESEGATWPPDRPAQPSPQPTPQPVPERTPSAIAGPGLLETLVALGLHRVPESDSTTATVVYAAMDGDRKVTVTIHPDDDYTAEVHMFDHGLLAWSATFTPGTPNAVIIAAAADAMPTADQTSDQTSHPDPN
jgi:hypothetical protein